MSQADVITAGKQLSLTLAQWLLSFALALFSLNVFTAQLTAEEAEAEEAISVAALLQDADLLDALIMGDPALNDSIAVRQSRPAPAGQAASQAESAEPPVLSLDTLPDTRELLPPPDPSWDLDTTLTLGAGYKKNALFSAYDKQNSAFTTAELESMIMRVAPRDQWQFYAYLLAENAHYFDVDGLDDEWLAIAMLQANKSVGRWKFGLAGQYTFLKQAFSLSFEDLDLGSTEIVLNQFGLKPSLEYQFLERAYLRVEVPVETSRFEESRQNYREYGVRMAAGQRLKRGGKVEARYSFAQRDYADREIRGLGGTSQVGTSLDWEDHRLDLALDYYFDADKAWRGRTLARVRRVMDNGFGHDDFWMYRLQQRLAYERPTWEVSAHASFDHYDYDTQTVEAGNSNRRHRSRFSLGGELEKTLAEDLTLSLAYTWEDYTSNVADDTYKMSVLSLTLGRSF